MRYLICLTFLFVANSRSTVVQFDQYKVYRSIPKSNSELQLLKLLETSEKDLDFWTSPRGKNVSVDIMIPPEKEAFIKEYFRNATIENKLIIENVQELIDKNSRKKRSTSEFSWSYYHNLSEIYNFLQHLSTVYPRQVTLLNIGKSYQGRNILGVKLSFNKGNKAVFIEGGFHAREWISPATVTFILMTFLTSPNLAIRDIAQSYDWYFFPVLNPDGYDYTFTVNRNWRKTLKPGKGCIGADLNRNFNFHWMDGGSSSWSCAVDYAGFKPFSEPESLALSKFIYQISNNLIAYFSFHSYSQLLLIPYGFTNKHLDNYDELMEIGQRAIRALAYRYGTKYVVGNVVDIIYPASGGSVDWVKGTFRTPITYTYELRDTGRYGFLLPPNQIIPTGEETVDSFVSIMRDAKTRGYY